MNWTVSFTFVSRVKFSTSTNWNYLDTHQSNKKKAPSQFSHRVADTKLFSPTFPAPPNDVYDEEYIMQEKKNSIMLKVKQNTLNGSNLYIENNVNMKMH